jgi:hypothetical protein
LYSYTIRIVPLSRLTLFVSLWNVNIKQFLRNLSIFFAIVSSRNWRSTATVCCHAWLRCYQIFLHRHWCVHHNYSWQLITRDRILMQLHIFFLQPESMLVWIYVCITSFLKFWTWFDGAYKCIFCLFYE